MRISDWSSDVCSSDLFADLAREIRRQLGAGSRESLDIPQRESVERGGVERFQGTSWAGHDAIIVPQSQRNLNVSAGQSDHGRGVRSTFSKPWFRGTDRKSAVEGKRLSVRVELSGRRSIKK